ncbi:FAD-dependent oxidoreductase [Neptuniibacter sp. CAU 1671]|uniref:NAD(P)/FAD-dependent oxidoreductase n=1 Tax=Neptuniibacter sp. CAU 1671 TaxID=3032593 RepID=UPI0023DA2699|nr:FAD-dependent oxidoreductase [Neptuniibacter sp. CAU 1671]MDF2182794.1 FAD-dependent oxidoreductase [Neptuniibacter sp. CAU 1671]
MSQEYIAIIGAGLAGAVVSQRLTQAGHKVTVFEKSRGSGGRMASCRLPNSSCDLGAPWIEPVSDRFREWLLAQPGVSAWQPRAIDFSGFPIQKHVYLTQPRQSSLTRHLLTAAEFRTQVRVGQLRASSGHGVALWDEEGNSLGGFDKVIVTAPAPQALPLLQSEPEIHYALSKVGTRPCWVAIVACPTAASPDLDLIEGEHPVLSRVICESSKSDCSPDTQTTVWRLEANPIWSAENIDNTPENIGQKLSQAFQETKRINAEVSVLRVHRWLYCTHTNPRSDEYYFNATSGVGACGDWFGHNGTESAWHSASALADQLLQNPI